MPEVTLSSSQVIETLGREEQRLKHLGLAAQAMGMRAAIVAVIRMVQHPDPPPSLDPSE